MKDTTIKKIDSSHSPKGSAGQLYLAAGKTVSMRLWKSEQATDEETDTTREYETVGYVIEGSAELHCEGQMVTLQPGDSWVVPMGASHHYHIVEPFTAVEATAPPAEVHGREGDLQPTSESEQEQSGSDSEGEEQKDEPMSREEKAKHDQEVVARLPRDSENLTSNAPEKERVPSEKNDEKGDKKDENDKSGDEKADQH